MALEPLPEIPPDIVIAQEAKTQHISRIAESLGLGEDDLDFYGQTKAKVRSHVFDRVEHSAQS